MPVIGAEELQRAFATAASEFSKDKRSKLRFLAEPVRRDAEILARGRIPRIGPEWSRMRTGSTPTMGYVAPVKRGTKIPSRKRRNFARLLLSRAMQPALAKNAPAIERQFDEMVKRMHYRFRRGR